MWKVEGQVVFIMQARSCLLHGSMITWFSSLPGGVDIFLAITKSNAYIVEENTL